MIIGCDYHPGFQQIAYVDTDTGEFAERRLAHREEAEQFYRELAARGIGVRVRRDFGKDPLGDGVGNRMCWIHRLKPLV